MRAIKILLATTALSLSAPALACPDDGGDHRYFAFASLLQTQRDMPEQSRGDEQPAPRGDRGSSDQPDQPQPEPSSNPGSSPTDTTDAATFR